VSRRPVSSWIGRIITAVYSTRAIGRLMPEDVPNFVRHFKKLRAAA
jgi:hypothetical protein